MTKNNKVIHVHAKLKISTHVINKIIRSRVSHSVLNNVIEANLITLKVNLNV